MGVVYVVTHSRSRPKRTVLEQSGNGTEIRWHCVGDRTVNGRARVPFKRNGTETSPFIWRILYMLTKSYT